MARRARRRLRRDRARLQPPAGDRSRVPGPAARARVLVGAVRRDAGGARRLQGRAAGGPLAAPPAADRARGARGARRRLAGDRRRRPRPAAACSRASRCTGASSPAGTGGRPTRSPCRPRRTGGGCASRSRSSATTPAGSPRCRRHAGHRRGPVGRADERGAPAPRVALIAGGVGIAPIRALLEDTPGEPGTIAVIYRAASEDDVLFRDELDELSRRRGAELHYVLGERRGDEILSAEHLQALVPDIAESRRLRLRPAQHDRGHAHQPAPRRRAAAPHHQRGVRLVSPRAVVRRAVPAALATAAVVALLANVRARPPAIPATDAAAPPPPQAATAEAEVRRVSSRPPTRKGRVRTRDGDRDHAVLDHLGARDADRRRADEGGDGRAERRRTLARRRSTPGPSPSCARRR